MSALDKNDDVGQIVHMRVIKESRIREYGISHSRARSSLEKWLAVVRVANWKSFDDVRKTFRSTDQVRVKSGRKVLVFDIGGNDYRLIAAIHYDRQKLFVLRFMPHAEYDENKWKETL
jgi:mRNA interferase HigB